MSKPRQRVCLDQSLKLDLNKLARQGLVPRGARVGPNVIRWSYTYTDEVIARALITANMEANTKVGSGSNLEAWINGSTS